MNYPIRTLTTRASLTATALHNARRCATLMAGAALLGTPALAINNFWEGDTPPGSTDWDVAGNWSLGRIPANPNGATTGDTYDDAFINIVSPSYPILTNNADFNPRDVKVGVGASTTGRLDIRTGTITSGGWVVIGDDGGNGTLNVADTSVPGTGITGFGTGVGGLSVAFRLYVGGEGTGSATGLANINTQGTVSLGEHLVVGNSGASGGTLNMEAGTLAVNGESWIGQGAGGVGQLNLAGGAINSNNWAAIGREGGNGTATITGGAWTKVGGGEFIVGDGATGKLDFPAGGEGTLSVNNQFWVGQAGAGRGTLEMHSGSLTAGSWLAIGREGGQGTVNMSGGTIRKTGGGTAFIVGSSGLGKMTMSGGNVEVEGVTWVAEGPGANGSELTLSGAATFTTPIMSVGPEGNGTLFLDSGSTLITGRITGKRATANGAGVDAAGGTGTINFNGGQIVATGSNPAFIADVDFTNIAAGGLHIDSAGFALGVSSSLNGPGGVIKTGEGQLTLSGLNSFSGASTVTAGALQVAADGTGGGSYTIADGATFGVSQVVATNALPVSGLTLGNSTLSILPSEAAGNPTSAVIQVSPTGTLAVNGTVTVNLMDLQPVMGSLPIISYTNRTGTGTFVPGNLPDGVVLNSANPLVDNGSVISLNIDRANAPNWTGAINGVWDTTTANWQNSYGDTPTTFANGDPAIFQDRDLNVTRYGVNLSTTVNPGGSGVTFDNIITDFTLNGSGKITGTSGLTKRGFLGLTIGNMSNDFTGPAVLEEGTVSVGLLGNAGSPSPLGAGDLVLAGGILDYTGPAVTLDRGFEVNAAVNTITSELILANNVTMSGPVNATSGKLRLSGPGLLTLNHPGAISLANGPEDSTPACFVLDGGGLTLNGPGQTATITGNTQIAVADGVNTALTVSGDTILNVNRFQAGFGFGSNTSILVEGTAAIRKLGASWMSIANSNDAVATMTIRDSGSLTNDGGDFNVGDTASSNGSLILEDNALVTTGGPVYVGKNGTTGLIDLNDASTMTGGNTDVAGGAGSNGDLNLSGTSIYTSNGRLLVGPGENSLGEVLIEGESELVVNSYTSVGFGGGGAMTIRGSGAYTGSDDFSVNENSATPATVTVQDTGSLTMAGTLFIGRNGGRVGTLTATGSATVNQTGSETQSFFVGLAGTGTLTIDDSATVNASSANGVIVGNDGAGIGTVNLLGGTLVGKRLAGGTGTSTVTFDGGLLTAAAGANPDYMSNLDNALVEDEGVRIDSNGQDITVAQALLAGTTAGGGLTKSGEGTLRLNGVNTFTGATTVTGGALGGTGTIPGSVTVQAGAGLSPGAPTGTLTVGGNVTLAAGSTFTVTVNNSEAAQNSRVDVTGTLNVSGANLVVNLAGSTATPYTIATGGTVTGTFASVPDGVNVTYGATSIIITPPAGSPFQSWIGQFDVGTLNQPGDDADGDGLTNLEEFALDGNPASGAATGKIRSGIQNVDGEDALVLTFPVRNGATFDNNPGPGADATVTADGVSYLVRGSRDLSAFDQPVTEVTVDTATMPELSEGWTYRSFRLAGTAGDANSRGFLDLEIGGVTP